MTGWQRCLAHNSGAYADFLPHANHHYSIFIPRIDTQRHLPDPPRPVIAPSTNATDTTDTTDTAQAYLTIYLPD